MRRQTTKRSMRNATRKRASTRVRGGSSSICGGGGSSVTLSLSLNMNGEYNTGNNNNGTGNNNRNDNNDDSAKVASMRNDDLRFDIYEPEQYCICFNDRTDNDHFRSLNCDNGGVEVHYGCYFRCIVGIKQSRSSIEASGSLQLTNGNSSINWIKNKWKKRWFTSSITTITQRTPLTAKKRRKIVTDI